MASLRVLIIGSNNKPTGGIPRYIPEQVQYLPDDVEASVYDIGAPEGRGLRWFLVSFLLAVRDAIIFPTTDRPDIAHVHTSQQFSFYRAAFYVLFCKYVWRCPVVLHIHGSSFDEFVSTESQLSRRLQSIVYSAADEVIVLSDYWKTELQTYIPEEKISVLPNAVDPTEYTPSFNASPSHVVFISNLIPRKGVNEVLAAVDALLEEGIDMKVSIAGKGPLTEEVERFSQDHENVAYLGYVSESEKRQLLCDGSIYVLPSYAEGLPIALVEAMAGGNAIVSTDVGSIPEVISEENGVLVTPGDVDELVDALRELVSSPERAREMAMNNRERVEADYSWSSVSSRLKRRYREHTEG